MVGLQILDLPIGVRVPASQPTFLLFFNVLLLLHLLSVTNGKT